MNAQPLLTGILLIFVLPAMCQEGMVTCTSERNQDGSYSIYAENKSFADYTVRVIFSDLGAYTSSLNPGSLTYIRKGKTQLAKLTLVNTSSQSLFSYHYQFWAGQFLRHPPDTGFVYLLPSTSSNSLRVGKVSSLQERLGQKRPEDFYAIAFNYKEGDTICASRAGLVYECSDAEKEAEKSETSFNRNRNRIFIQQKDGTLAHYMVLSTIKLLVSPGEIVFPG